MQPSQFSLVPTLRAPVPAPPLPHRACPIGFAPGTRIATVWGARPVEHLQAGDLLRDADGQIVELRSLKCALAPADTLVLLSPGSASDLESTLIVGAGQELLLGDWRSHILFDGPVMAPARAFVNGVQIRAGMRRATRLYQLGCDEDRIVLANRLRALVPGAR